MARPTIEQVRSVELTSLYRWDLQFLPKNSGLELDEEVNLRCESTELPKKTNAPVENNIRGHKTKSPGITSYAGTITMTFVETTDNKIAKVLKACRDLLWDPATGKRRPKSELEFDIMIVRLDNDDKPIWQYKLIGCFVEDDDPGGTLDGSTPDPLKPTATISYDYFKDEARG